MPHFLAALSLSIALLGAASCHGELARPCDPFRTPRLQSPPVPKEEERSSHAPYILGDCTVCHAPHRPVAGESLAEAALPGLAYGPVNERCLDCHGELFRAPPKAHPPRQSYCTTCHNPHNSRQPSLLLDDDHTRPCSDGPPPYPDKPLASPRRKRPVAARAEPGPG